MKNLIVSILLISLPIPPLSSQNYILQHEKSTLTWTGKAAFNSYSLSGNLAPASCSLEVENGRVKKAQLIVDMKSLDAENKDLKKHLKSKDFFEVKKYPQAIFELNQAWAFKEGDQAFSGLLSIKNQTHPLDIPIHIEKKGSDWIMTGKMIVDRTKYGIYYNSPNFFDKLKGQAVADEFELVFELYFTHSPTQ